MLDIAIVAESVDMVGGIDVVLLLLVVHLVYYVVGIYSAEALQLLLLLGVLKIVD